MTEFSLLKRLRTMAGIGWNPIGDEAADEIERLERRVEELERGPCRFNCRTQREAFVAGFLAGWKKKAWCVKPGSDGRHANAAYREWKKETGDD